MATLIGRTLGRYQILDRLGRGGMADVYKAYQASLSRPVAIKVMHGHLTEDESFIGRFEREAAAVAQLRHPNIVQVYDFNVEDDLYYMVMEFVEGPTLKAVLEEQSAQEQIFSLEETIHIFGALASAIDYAHGHGVVHRDLKPANIMFTDEGQVVLTDFGIALITGATAFTETGTTTGTPAYMSPEQGKGERGDEQSDIYSLGVILYEMVTGRVPFEAETPIGVILKQITEPAPAPTAVNPNLPTKIDEIIAKAMSKQPPHRYSTSGEMMEALRKAAGLAASPTRKTALSPLGQEVREQAQS